MSARRFSQRQRIALYLAADGRCTTCDIDLETGWHADHVAPHSRGGATDVINGQALCPTCNLRKGARVNRPWQDKLIRQYFDVDGRNDYLVSATPGSGKTHVTREIARQLLDDDQVDLVVVVAPTDALRDQWADSARLRLYPAHSAEDLLKAGYEGFVVTYQQVGRGMGDLLRRLCGRTRTLVVLDELHHAGDGTSWGEGLRHAFEQATRRLALTGTPWRQDRSSPIPFVTYDTDGKVLPDFSYGYGEAVREGVCRVIAFHAYDAESRWADCGKTVQGRLSGDLDDDDIHVAMRAVLLADQPWIPTVLQLAARDLDNLRADLSPDAACLIVAETQFLAKAYAKIWTHITGESPAVVISEDATAKQALDAFRDDEAARCIIAVRMVSEGIDIPRLAVGVYATPILTPLFFRQVVGRFVRRRADEEHAVSLFLPAVERLLVYAREIEEELRHELDQELKDRDGLGGPISGSQTTFELRTPLSSSDAVFNGAIMSGEEYSPTDIDTAVEACRNVGIPERYATKIAAVLRRHTPFQDGVKVTFTQETPPQPQHKIEKRLRAETARLGSKLAFREGMEPQEINTMILKLGYPPRAKCSIAQLEDILAVLAKWWDEWR